MKLGRLVVLPETRSAGPAFGCALTYTGATRESSCTYCRSAWAPSAQLSPTLSGRPCATEFPERLPSSAPKACRPLASTIVPEIITGEPLPDLVEQRLEGEQRRLRVERVENGLDQD